jgi:2-C-methyl-D-erythritol 4-phosphate cytidylyltransferase
MSTVNKSVVIVAGGKGERMQTAISKQFLEMKGKPVLMHTIEAFYRYESMMQIIVVLPRNQVALWETLCKKQAFAVNHQITAGGETRFHSVKNGLALVCASVDFIAVHDGVRPFVSNDTIEKCFAMCLKYNAVVPCVDLVDSVRKVSDGEKNRAVNRADYKLIQTPQVFERKTLLDAYKQDFSPRFTDDASVVANYGVAIHLFAGNTEKNKNQTAFDFRIATGLCRPLSGE